MTLHMAGLLKQEVLLSARRWVSVGKPEEMYLQSSCVMAASVSCAYARAAELIVHWAGHPWDDSGPKRVLSSYARLP